MQEQTEIWSIHIKNWRVLRRRLWLPLHTDHIGTTWGQAKRRPWPSPLQPHLGHPGKTALKTSAILGAAIMRFSNKNKSGNLIETRQITYVTYNSDKLFISREACNSLGMIPDTFPTIGQISNHQSSSTVSDKPRITVPQSVDARVVRHHHHYHHAYHSKPEEMMKWWCF